MGMARTAMANPRVFLLGAGLGALLIGAGFVLAVLATGRASAAPGGPATVYACVNLYTGQTRLKYPGQPANCTASEFEVALSTDNPGANLDVVARHYDHSLSNGTAGAAQVACKSGERAVGGGVELMNDEGNAVVSHDFILNSSSPIGGNPATGWRASYEWTAALSAHTARVTVLCVS